MAINRGGRWWTGTGPLDLDEYLVAFSADGYPVTQVRHASCSCGAEEFTVRVDDAEGCAERTCVACGKATLLLDSDETKDDAELEEAACPCGNETFNVAVGFALYDGGNDIRWVYLGLRCTDDGVLGAYTDWKIDYTPSSHLYERV